MLLRTLRELSLSAYEMSRKTLSIVAILLAACLVNSCSSKRSSHNTRILPVSMRKFAIEPDVIQVKQGEDVVLVVSTGDVQHGFEVDDMGINEPIQPGKSASIHLDTSKKGEFNVACSIICGPGHNEMTAKIVVR